MSVALVSFVVPVYNAAKFLPQCLDSLLYQSFSDFEIILVDDGSTDESLQLCDSFASKDARIRVCHQQNQGVSVARNNGIELAQGDYVAFVDADDWIDANVCEIFVESLKECDYDLFCYSAVYHKGDKSIESLLFGSDILLLSEKQREELLCKIMTPWTPWFEYNCNTRFAGSSCGKFYKTKILKDLKLTFVEKLAISEDVLFNVLAMDAFKTVGFSARSFYHYEQRGDSAQNRYRPNSMVHFKKVIDEIQKWMAVAPRSQKVNDSANTLFVHYFFGLLKEDFFHKDNPDKSLGRKELEFVLNQEKYQRILDEANSKYFTMPERLLILLLKNKRVYLIEILLKAYNAMVEIR